MTTIQPPRRSSDPHNAMRPDPATRQRPATVVVVDDNETNRTLLRRILARRPGLQVLSESDGRRGLDLIRQRNPDLVLLDLHLPTIDGETVVREIRSDPATAATPVLVISGDANPATKRRLRETGAGPTGGSPRATRSCPGPTAPPQTPFRDGEFVRFDADAGEPGFARLPRRKLLCRCQRWLQAAVARLFRTGLGSPEWMARWRRRAGRAGRVASDRLSTVRSGLSTVCAVVVANGGSQLRVPRILVVDDEPDQRFLLRRVFERAGHQVVEAGDGAAALDSARESPPDLVVTDLMMPVMDGVELIRRLRSEPATAAVPILSVSGDWHLGGAADAVVPKPYDWHELIEVADGLLKKEGGAG